MGRGGDRRRGTVAWRLWGRQSCLQPPFQAASSGTFSPALLSPEADRGTLKRAPEGISAPFFLMGNCYDRTCCQADIPASPFSSR
jgi:hypothetical protein